MSKPIVWLHMVGWLAAGVILVVSFLSAAKLGVDKLSTASGKGFYWNGPILQDHIFYPGLMVIDQLALRTTTEPETRVYMQVNYAYRRLSAAEELVRKQKNDLAFTTLTKAQKYLNQAAQEALNPKVSMTERRMVIRAIDYQNSEVEKLVLNFTVFDQGVLNHLRSESEIWEEKLIESLESAEKINKIF